jgi:hypothetical protein
MAISDPNPDFGPTARAVVLAIKRYTGEFVDRSPVSLHVNF